MYQQVILIWKSVVLLFMMNSNTVMVLMLLLITQQIFVLVMVMVLSTKLMDLVLTVTVTITNSTLTKTILLVNNKILLMIVLTGMNFSTELTVSVLMVCKENITVLMIMNISAHKLFLVNYGVLMIPVIVLKILILVKMNGDHYAYLMT